LQDIGNKLQAYQEHVSPQNTISISTVRLINATSIVRDRSQENVVNAHGSYYSMVVVTQLKATLARDFLFLFFFIKSNHLIP
jgi:hypothetical protein